MERGGWQEFSPGDSPFRMDLVERAVVHQFLPWSACTGWLRELSVGVVLFFLPEACQGRSWGG